MGSGKVRLDAIERFEDVDEFPEIRMAWPLIADADFRGPSSAVVSMMAGEWYPPRLGRQIPPWDDEDYDGWSATIGYD